VDTQEDPKDGDPRIVITLNGKFLPFRTWWLIKKSIYII
jgi:cyanate lyase